MAYAAFMMVILLSVTGCARKFNKPFSTQKWVAGTPDERGAMLCDLLAITPANWDGPRRLNNQHYRNSQLWGLQESGVIALLGEPDNKLGTACIYNVGRLNERRPGDGDFALMIFFDATGAITTVWVSD